MAIYKPSNCTPFLDSLDFSEDHDIQCELNTSNSQVVGYKVKVTDSLNNTILEGSEFTPLNDPSLNGYENSGLNGTMLKVPFVVSSPEYSNKNNVFFGGYNWDFWKPDYKEITDDGKYYYSGHQSTGLKELYFYGKQYIRITMLNVKSSFYSTLTINDIYVKINGYFRTLTSQSLEKPSYNYIDNYDYYLLYGQENVYTRIYKKRSYDLDVDVAFNEKDYTHIYGGVFYEFNTISSLGVSKPATSAEANKMGYCVVSSGSYTTISDGYASYENLQTTDIYIPSIVIPTKEQAIDNNVYFRGYSLINADIIGPEKYNLIDKVYKKHTSFINVSLIQDLQKEILEERYYNDYYEPWDVKPTYEFAYKRCFYRNASSQFNNYFLVDSLEKYNSADILYDKIINYNRIDMLNRPEWTSVSSLEIYYKKKYYSLFNMKPSRDEAIANGYFYLSDWSKFSIIDSNISVVDYENIVSVYKNETTYNPLIQSNFNSPNGIFNYELIETESDYNNAPIIYEKSYISVAGISENFYKNNINRLYFENSTYEEVVKPNSFLEAAYSKLYFIDNYKPVSLIYCEYRNLSNELRSYFNHNSILKLSVHDNGDFYKISNIKYTNNSDLVNNAVCYADFLEVTKPSTKNDAVLLGLYYYLGQNISSRYINRYIKITEDMYDGDYNSLEHVYKYNGFKEFESYDADVPQYIKIDNFYNGYINQPYKWEITLMQGDLGAEKIEDVRSKWFDMQVTNGIVIGSCPTRLQGLFSEEIYKDYYVQLYHADSNNTLSAVGNRVRIDAYDGSFGYIYPQSGSIEDSNINGSEYFSVYKYTNDPEYVSANRKVNYATTVNIDTVSYNGNMPVADIGKFRKASGYSSYYTQIYSGTISISDLDIHNYDTGANNMQIQTGIGGTSILIKNQGSNNSSALNGVYYLDSLEYVYDTVNTTQINQTIIKWVRAADADSFSDFINGVFYIISGTYSGKNYVCDASAGGVIDSTPIKFNEEAPVLLYPVNNDSAKQAKHRSYYWENITDNTTDSFGHSVVQYYSPLFKNSTTQTFVRPFIGLQDDMMFQYGETPIDSVLIKSIDTDIWAISHDTLQYNKVLKANTDRYIVLSYYKTSNENPFYAYKKPYIDIDIGNITKNVDNYGYPIIINRYVVSDAVYIQEQNKSWRNYQWILKDITNDLEIDRTNTIYYGSFTNKFIGLENNNRYRLTLTIDNELGYVQEVYREFVLFGNLEYGTLPIITTQECMSHSVDMLIMRIGTVEPTPSLQNSDIIRYENEEMIIENGEADRDYAVKYDSVRSFGGTAPLTPPKTNNLRVVSSHKFDQYYQGNVITYYFNEFDENIGPVFNDSYRLVIDIICEPDTIIENEEIVVNPYRNCFSFKYYKEKYNSSGVWVIDGEILKYDKYIWRNSNNRAKFSLININNSFNNEYDYIYTTAAYDSNGNIISGYYNLASKYYNVMLNSMDNTRNEFIYKYNTSYSDYTPRIDNTNASPLCSSVPSGTDVTFGCWYDELMYHNSDTGVLLTTREPAYWNDGSYIWSDESYGFYEQADANAVDGHNRSGKQQLSNRIFKFDISILNYNIDEHTGPISYNVYFYDGQNLLNILT